MIKEISLQEYLSMKYVVENIEDLPLADERFVIKWQKKTGIQVLNYLQHVMQLDINNFIWQKPEGMRIDFIQTLGGRLPFIKTINHGDFCALAALVNGRKESVQLPLNVNAFTMQVRALPIFGQRMILVNEAPYSNVAADRLGISEVDWLAKSAILRLRHEGLHYESLRLFNGMKNHAMDEIVADALGQLAAFGKFSAERQRIFFGLKKGQRDCQGRLSFYCQNLCEKDKRVIYQLTDKALDVVERIIEHWSQQNLPEIVLIKELLGKNLQELAEYE